MATIGATGIVRSNQTTTLNWQTSGIVAEIQANIGETINKGAEIASLAPESLPQNVLLAKVDLVNAKKTLDNLKSSNTAQAQAQLALANAQKAFDDARSVRLNLNARQTNKNATSNAEAQYIIANNALEAAQSRYDQLASLADDNPNKAQAYTALYTAQQAVKSRLNTWNWYKTQASQQEIAQADAKLALATSQLTDAQLEWDRLKNGPDPADITSAEVRVTAIQATVNTSMIKAPFSGTITEAKQIVGDQVSPGMPAFRIDDLSRLLVDVQVSEVDINSVMVDQPVTLSLDAILDVTYHGKVISVAQVGNTSQGGVTFTVSVELTDADKNVKPGMTSAVTIVVNQKENVLLVPNRAVRLVNNQRVVYILKDGKPLETKVTLGATSGIESEVLSGGLKEGDLVILNPPINFGEGNRPGGGGMFGG